VTVATALELIGAHIDPSERMLTEQFAGIDMRLDEISRAIAAGGRSSVPSTDTVTIRTDRGPDCGNCPADRGNCGQGGRARRPGRRTRAAPRSADGADRGPEQ